MGGSTRAGCLAAGLVAAATALAGCTTTDGPAPQAPPVPVPNGLAEGITADGAMVHVDALQRIADENGGHRASPGSGYDASVEYVVGVLRGAGFDVGTPSFRFEREDDTGDEFEASGRNVVAQTRTGSADRVVLVGAHLDSVPAGPGINDNASGVAALLEIAEGLGGSPRLPGAVRFAFWGAEEPGLYGSGAYVRSLAGAERDEIAAYVNVDMVASPNSGYFVQGGAGDDEEETGPAGSARIGRVLVEELQAVSVVPELVPFDDGSDYAAFVEAGIPSGGVYAGDEGTKTPEQAARWGGTAGADFDPCYHAACDRSDGIDRVALERFGDALAATVARIAVEPGR